MTHCLASCDSLMSSSFADAEPAANTAAVLRTVLVRNFRIPFLPVTLPPRCSDADKPKRARSRHKSLPGEAFPAACHGCKVRGPFFSRTYMAYEETPTLPNTDVLEAGNYYLY